MTVACLKTADLTRDGFLELIASLDPPVAGSVTRRIWLEAADGWAFDWWHGVDYDLRWCAAGREPTTQRTGSCLSRSAAGRLFAPDGELRWRVIAALGETCWRTVFLGDADWTGDALEDRSGVLETLQPKRERYYLWGQQTEASPEEWIELRIPHRFRYPVAGGSRHVKAVVERWRDDVGEPHFLRLCDLEPAAGGPDA